MKLYHLRGSEASRTLNCGLDPKGQHEWMLYWCADRGLDETGRPVPPSDGEWCPPCLARVQPSLADIARGAALATRSAEKRVLTAVGRFLATVDGPRAAPLLVDNDSQRSTLSAVCATARTWLATMHAEAAAMDVVPNRRIALWLSSCPECVGMHPEANPHVGGWCSCKCHPRFRTTGP